MTSIAPRSLALLHVVDSLEFGGLERVVTDLAIAQRDAGHRVAVFSINATTGFRPTLETAGIEVLVGDKHGTLDRAVLRALRAASVGRGIDVIHAHNFVPNYYAAFASLFARRAPVLVGTCHDMGMRLSHRRLRWLYRWSLTRTARVAMVGQQVCDRFVQSGIVRPDRAVTVLNGIPVERFRNTDARRLAARAALGIAPDAPVIGCVGRLVGLKNHRLLLEQVPALVARHPQLQVVLAGDGPLRADLAAQAQGLKIADRVHLLGARNDVADILPAFDVFALPSQTEGLSIALLEACATGLAIVATKVGGNPEIVHHGDTGLLVEVDDGPGLGAALETLLDDAALRARLGANACDWVAQHASVDALRLAYDAFYAAALATR